MNVVLDSSAVAKLFIREKGSNEMIHLMALAADDGVDTLASELVIFEVGNVIWKTMKGRKLDARDYMEHLFGLNIEYIPLQKALSCHAMKLAQERDITFYDAAHVALARERQTSLVTEDRELLKKFERALTIAEALEKLERMD